MSYQVLARKWRPKNFQELRGQEHVSRALVNAIESGRLHHAYLFTGTRGVGKTTIARILSKCLNCEAEGITATPCGQCGSCTEIDEGRFVDLIEVDAASRTKVDDTRELLENVQYRPTRGRYKVYLIDEVHMLSNSSFNALLKTLEEPPEHVIFLLATTDPQKLPVTVLSRCLQFHLKHMDEETIANHLTFILEQESINFESVALQLIAQSAEGSMRDALSLLDQAIAYGQGKVLEEDIRTMLGTIDHKFMVRLLEALASRDSVMAIKAVDDMSHYPVDFADALKELLSRIHQIAVYQSTQVLLDSAASYVSEFAEVFEAADLQMYYQLGLHARRDLEWAPTARQGLEMALLRMLAFQIDTGSEQKGPQAPKKKVSISSSSSTTVNQAQKQSQETAHEADGQSQSKIESQTVESPNKELSEVEQLVNQPSSGTKADVVSDEVDASKKETIAEVVSSQQSVPKPPVAQPDSKEQTNLDESVKAQSQAISKDNIEETTSAVSDEQSKSSSVDDFSGYEQFIQQDEEDQEELSILGFEQPPVIEKPQVSEKEDNSGDDEALASLHSALGLNLTGTEPKPQVETPKSAGSIAVESKEPVFQEENPKTPQDLHHQALVDQNASEPHSQEADDDEPEPVSYDSDIERLMQAKHDFDQQPQEEPTAQNSTLNEYQTQNLQPDDAEPEFIPELDVSEEAMEWANLVKKLELDGTYHQIAQSSSAIWSSDQTLTLELAPEQEILLTDSAKKSVRSSLSTYLGKEVTIDWQLKQPSMETPAEIWQHQAKLRLQKACEDLNQHPFSQELQKQFGAKLDRQSVVYLND
ncbi:hypothetical protein GCM10009123_00580 [Kangiella japonica]|uniref:DNA-directed DNA polymerase n=1 Tax=Kangiella japonica TaxID=647384 RepID=A0ABN0ST45_9GAMM